MGKKKYVKPRMHEESYILTIRAFITTTTTDVLLQDYATTVSAIAAVDLVNAVTTDNVAIADRVSRTAFGAQNALANAMRRISV